MSDLVYGGEVHDEEVTYLYLASDTSSYNTGDGIVLSCGYTSVQASHLINPSFFYRVVFCHSLSCQRSCVCTVLYVFSFRDRSAIQRDLPHVS